MTTPTPSRLLGTARRCAALALTGSLVAACAPRARPLRGAPTTARIPAAGLPAGHQQINFRWDFSDGYVGVSGEGVARTAAPDSARLDFFIDNGLGGGYAVLIADSVAVPPGAEQVRRLLPPVTLLWAALGRLAIPPAADTTVRVEGRILRAEIGGDSRWRVTFDSTRLAAVTRIARGREAERLTRTADGKVNYLHLTTQRRLSLTITRPARPAEFDATIWRP